MTLALVPLRESMNGRKSTKFILNLLGFGTAISLLGDATLYTVLPHPDIYSQLGITLSNVGVLLGANRATRLILNGPVGVLYDRLPRRGLLIAALSIGAISSIFYAIGRGFWVLLFGRIFWGLAWSLLWVGGNSVVLDISTKRNRGRYSGIYQRWFYVGIASSAFFGAVLTDLFGFSGGQWISVGIITAAALSWVFFMPETKGFDAANKIAPKKKDKLETSKLPIREMAIASITILVSRFLTWGVLAATAIVWLSGMFGKGAQISNIFIPIATLTGLYTAIRSLTSIGSTPLVGTASDKLGRRWPIIGLAMVLGSVGLWLMSGEMRILAFVGAILVPLAGSSTETLIPAIAGDYVSEKMRSRALGLINTAGDLGATIGPFAALSALNSEWLSLSEIYKLGSIFFLLVAVMALSPLGKRQP